MKGPRRSGCCSRSPCTHTSGLHLFHTASFKSKLSIARVQCHFRCNSTIIQSFSVFHVLQKCFIISPNKDLLLTFSKTCQIKWQAFESPLHNAWASRARMYTLISRTFEEIICSRSVLNNCTKIIHKHNPSLTKSILAHHS